MWNSPWEPLGLPLSLFASLRHAVGRIIDVCKSPLGVGGWQENRRGKGKEEIIGGDAREKIEPVDGHHGLGWLFS